MKDCACVCVCACARARARAWFPNFNFLTNYPIFTKPYMFVTPSEDSQIHIFTGIHPVVL
jgi:hypothetical protein